jgi:hypothetical protein
VLLVLFFLFAGLFAGCGKSSPAVPSSGASASGPAPSVVLGAALPDAEALDPREADLWGRAEDGGADDLMRLADREGSSGLVERAADPGLRRTALRAMAFVHDFVGLPLLADAAAGGDEADARAALESAVELAAARRTARDPEDAEELKEGCDKLLALAKDAAAPKARRVLAADALRMLSERGCVKREEVPTGL